MGPINGAWRARMLEGKLILVTNVPDFTPAEVVARYKALADIEMERGFRVLKPEIDIAPVCSTACLTGSVVTR
jgi:hypothetical protein